MRWTALISPLTRTRGGGYTRDLRNPNRAYRVGNAPSPTPFKTSVREPPQPPAMQHVAHGREIADQREVVGERMVHLRSRASRAAKIAVRVNGSSLLSNSSRRHSTNIIKPLQHARAPLT